MGGEQEASEERARGGSSKWPNSLKLPENLH